MFAALLAVGAATLFARARSSLGVTTSASKQYHPAEPARCGTALLCVRNG